MNNKYYIGIVKKALKVYEDYFKEVEKSKFYKNRANELLKTSNIQSECLQKTHFENAQLRRQIASKDEEILKLKQQLKLKDKQVEKSIPNGFTCVA